MFENMRVSESRQHLLLDETSAKRGLPLKPRGDGKKRPPYFGGHRIQ
jgi:hypothetical protein